MQADIDFIIPENLLFNGITGLLAFVENDCKTQQKEQQVLYRMLRNIHFNNVYYYDQAVKLFSRENANPRFLEASIGYNLERASMPHIHILLPSESITTTIGQDEGYLSPDFNEENQTLYSTHTARADATYNLMITSNNSIEVIMIYHIVRNLLMGIQYQLETIGLYNIQFLGQDLTLDNGMIGVPPDTFHRNLGIRFHYDIKIVSLFERDYRTAWKFFSK